MIVQSLGFEIRKIGSLSDLYKEVDVVLGKLSYIIEVGTVAHALQKMFKPDQWPDVCNIRECAKICNIVIPQERMSIYSIVHCMHWSEMTEDYQRLIKAMLLDDFRTVLCPQEVR